MLLLWLLCLLERMIISLCVEGGRYRGRATGQRLACVRVKL